MHSFFDEKNKKEVNNDIKIAIDVTTELRDQSLDKHVKKHSQEYINTMMERGLSREDAEKVLKESIESTREESDKNIESEFQQKETEVLKTMTPSGRKS